MNKLTLAVAALLLASTFAISSADAQGRIRGAHARPGGGFAAGQAHHNVGPNGGERVGGRGIVTDGQGNAVAGSANCVSGSAGRACRAGKTTLSSDGAIARSGGVAVEGANGGTFATTGDFTHNADGTTAARNTTAQTANGTYTAQTTYNPETGKTRTVTCTNASGAVVACPTH
ncbi:MAG: hypothetical protein GC155_13170 [Alphaproteobacteria bacterium]|nr:hypothetical protein [Alphaproteobacteria bacterium]